jgi:hypothetical protein
MNALGFVLLFCLEDELLEDIVGARDDGDGDGFAARVELALALDAEPVSAEEDGVGGVVSGLEDDTGAGFLDQWGVGVVGARGGAIGIAGPLC